MSFSFSHSSWGIDQDSENYINWINTKENNRWGINWNDWYPINFRGFEDDAQLYLTTSTHNYSFKLTFLIIMELITLLILMIIKLVLLTQHLFIKYHLKIFKLLKETYKKIELNN